MDTTLCAMCQVKEESCQHLFLECKHAQKVWSLCFKWSGISFVQQNDLNSHFLSFHLSKASNKWFGKVFGQLLLDVSGIKGT